MVSLHLLKQLLFDRQEAKLQLMDLLESAQSEHQVVHSFHGTGGTTPLSILEPSLMRRSLSCRDKSMGALIPFDATPKLQNNFLLFFFSTTNIQMHDI